MIRAIVFVSSMLSSMFVQAAPCPAHAYTPSQNVRTGDGPVLIVTHPSTQWDGRFVSKLGMDAAVANAKKLNIPVVYLQDQEPTNSQTYFFSDCNPTYWVSSYGGEFSFDVKNHHVISVGGHWEMCQRTTLDDLFRKQWSKMRGGDLRLTQIMDGIYSHPLSSMGPSDPYYSKMQEFLEIVTYGRPQDWPFPKTNLLENMGIIKDPALQAAYLERGLPPLNVISTIYSIQLIINQGAPKLLRRGTGSNPPMLTLEFLDSLYASGPIPDARVPQTGRRGECATVGCFRRGLRN